MRTRARSLVVTTLAVSALAIIVPGSSASPLVTPDGHASGDLAITQAFGSTGSAQGWTVPSGVTSVRVTARGAAGSAGESPVGGGNGSSTIATSGGSGGNGGTVQAPIPTSGGQQLTFEVGSVGGVRGGGYNGGGSGGLGAASGDQQCGVINSTLYSPCRGGGGGGATDVRSGGTGIGDRVLVAGGGGGGGGGFMGYYSAPAAASGSGSGDGPSSSVAGSGGNGANGQYGNTYPGTYGRGGGGGGGGYVGGGGAAPVAPGDGPNGGGGGTDWVDPSLTDASITRGTNGGNGSVTLAYTAPSDLQLDLSSTHVRADGTDSITATVTLTAGGVAMPGQSASITADRGVTVGAVTDHGDGTYTATLSGAGLATSVGAGTVSATIGTLTGTRSLDVESGPPAFLVLTTDHGVLAPGDTDGATLTATVVDAGFHAVLGAPVVLTSSTDAGSTPMSASGEGTYTAHVDGNGANTTYTASTSGITGSVVLGTHPGAGSAAVVRTFGATGAAQTWTVPVGVTSATVIARGARGGNGQNRGVGGQGGQATGTLPVSAGRNLVVMVGGVGGASGASSNNQSNGGFNGGGSGCTFPNCLFGGTYVAAGGGGASDLRLSDGLGGRLLVAGGGGGTGGQSYFETAGCPGGQGPFTTTPGQGYSTPSSSYQYSYPGGGGGYLGGANCGYSTGGGGGSDFALTTGPLGTTGTSTATGGNAGAGSVAISYLQPGTLSAASPTARLRADGSSTIPVTARLVDGSGTALVGARLTATVDHGASASDVVDNGDGTYTTTITSGSSLADLTVRWSTGTLSATALVHEKPSTVALRLSAPTVVGDGTSSVVATATFADGATTGTAGESVTIGVAGGHTGAGPITDHGDGTYTTTITSTTALGGDTVTASNGDLSTTTTLQVVPGPLASFTFSDPGLVTAGSPATVAVTAHDDFGHVATSYAGTPGVTEDLEGAATGCGAKASDGCAHTVTLGSFVGGVATLSMTAYRSTSAGHVTLTDGSVQDAVTPFAVAPEAAHHLDVVAPATPLQVGRPGVVTISARDRFDNAATSWTGPLVVSSSDPSATFSTTPTIAAGEHGSTTVDITLGTAGTQTLTASAAGVGSGTATLSGLLAPTITSANVVTFRGGDPGQMFRITTNPGFPGTSTVDLVGSLPRGLTVVPGAAGTLTVEGTPRVADAGTWPVTVVASNDAGRSVQNLVVTVTAPPQFATAATARGRVGEAFVFKTSVTGSPAPTLTVDHRPKWLKVTQLSSGALRLTGRPTKAHVYVVRLSADSAAGSTKQILTVSVRR